MNEQPVVVTAQDYRNRQIAQARAEGAALLQADGPVGGVFEVDGVRCRHNERGEVVPVEPEEPRKAVKP